MWHLQKDRHIDQWKKRESPKINPYKYSCLIFDKSLKVIQLKMVFEINSTVRIFGHPYAKKKKNLDLNLTPHTIISSKWILTLNAKDETIKLLEENR